MNQAVQKLAAAALVALSIPVLLIVTLLLAFASSDCQMDVTGMGSSECRVDYTSVGDVLLLLLIPPSVVVLLLAPAARLWGYSWEQSILGSWSVVFGLLLLVGLILASG